ncbi:MAG: hypothetical protein WC346_12660 [Methanogenium sp.]|jgi:hypothetical protein
MEGKDHDLLVEIHTTVRSIQKDMENFKRDMDNYVRKEEFQPIKSLVYGVVGLILIAVVGAALSYIIMKNTNTPSNNQVAQSTTV